MLYNVYMSQDARLDEEHSTQRRARVLGMDYVDTSLIQEKTLYRELLNIDELRNMKVIPIHADKNNILFGVTTTTAHNVMEDLKQRFIEQRLNFSIISDTGFRDYMLLYDPPSKVVYKDIDVEQAASGSMIDEISSILSQVRADDMLAYIVAQAHKLNSSDIHIETQTDYVRIRLRIDGVLHPIARLTPDKYRTLISAIASAGNVSTSTDQAQQGHISEKVTMADGTKVDVNVRLETVPTINGMDVVMRLFNMDQSMYKLDKLDLNKNERAIVDDIIAKPSGLVMVVGPTGSGKTTTLYSMLNTLNTEERKIITLEDPVEYQFPGISQISIHSSEGGNDNSFSDKLRAVLRLDPDIVMIGEIRDMDTAKTALQAALTGHLVLSTFHASSASAALTRMSEIIGQNPLFVSAIRLVMAQRLVRKLDDTLKQPYVPSAAEIAKIQQVLATLPANYPRPSLENLKLYTPGKSQENPYGFKGQIAVREQFTMTSKLRELLENPKAMVSTQTIEEAAIASGMLTMVQYGILRVLSGETTLDEVFRVVG
jgi:type II secretory ATPase GspE/PulE/Tfp pilus assembly ATPase PilB-like protein